MGFKENVTNGDVISRIKMLSWRKKKSLFENFYASSNPKRHYGSFNPKLITQ